MSFFCHFFYIFMMFRAKSAVLCDIGRYFAFFQLANLIFYLINKPLGNIIFEDILWQ